jgi:hypothetical protein
MPGTHLQVITGWGSSLLFLLSSRCGPGKTGPCRTNPGRAGREGSIRAAPVSYLIPGKGQDVTPKRPGYLVQWDTSGRFSAGDIIAHDQYNAAKEEYEVRMKDWSGDAQKGEDGAFHISGRKRDLVKGFLEEKRYALTAEYYHYAIRARGKKVDPAAIRQKIQDLGLSCLWVHVTGETGPERNPRARR